MLSEYLQDGRTGKASSKRLCMLLACFSLSISAVVLSVATLYGHDTAGALAAVCVPLAALGGAGYVGGKHVERNAAE